MLVISMVVGEAIDVFCVFRVANPAVGYASNQSRSQAKEAAEAQTEAKTELVEAKKSTA